MVLDGLPQAMWFAFWRWRMLYFRYSVEGIERLETRRPMLIVGYHGRPVAYDMCMLTVALYDRLGYLPHAFVHREPDRFPPARWFREQLGFLTGDGPELAAAVARREHVMVTPGGGDEAGRGPLQRYHVAWSDRRGAYVRLAVRYGLPIVPVAADGIDDTYVTFYDAIALGRRLGLPTNVIVPWLGIGPLGAWPLSPPIPVRVRQLIGEPMDPRADGVTSPDDVDGVLRFHRRVQAAVQGLLDRARGLER